MALALVQQKAPGSTGTGTGNGFLSPSGTATQTFTSATTSGNLIAVVILGYDGLSTSSSLVVNTDNKGNTYTRAVELGANQHKVAVFYSANITGGSGHAVTITHSGGDNYVTFAILEISGAETASVLDSSATATASSALSGGSASVTSGALAQANNFVIGVLAGYDATAGWTGPSSPWTTIYNRNAESTDSEGHCAWQITSSTSAVTFTCTASGTTSPARAIVAFKEAAGGGSGIPDGFLSGAVVTQPGGALLTSALSPIATDPTVLFEAGKYRCWFSTYEYNGGSLRLGIAYAEGTAVNEMTMYAIPSDVLADLVVKPSDSYDTNGCETACVIRVGTALWMYYTARAGNVYTIRRAVCSSGDGITWTKDATPCVSGTLSYDTAVGSIGGCLEPSVIYDGSRFVMYYVGWNATDFVVMRATSTDGITWTKRSTPVFTKGTAGAYDDKVISHVHVTNTLVGPLMLYHGITTLDDAENSGVTGFQKGRIFLATSEDDGITWTRTPDPVITPRVWSCGGPTTITQGADVYVWWFDGDEDYITDLLASFFVYNDANPPKKRPTRPIRPNWITPANWAKIQQITGPLYTVEEVAKWGANWQEHDDEFVAATATQWQYWVADGNMGTDALYETLNFYDRAKCYFVHYLRSGDPTSLIRGNEIAIDFRDTYCYQVPLDLFGVPWRIVDYWGMMEGLALHYLITGDTESWTAVGKVADWFRNDSSYPGLLALADVEGRQPAYWLKSAVLAHIIGAPSDYGLNWQTVSTYWKNAAIALYDSGTGKYNFIDDGAVGNPSRPQKPWQTCLLNNSYMLYMRAFGHDATLSNAIKGSVDWIDANCYDAGTVGFKYAEFDFTYSFGSTEDSLPTADLNNMMTPSYGYCWAKTGTKSYLTRMLACFDSGNDATNPSSTATVTKMTNQNYQYSTLVHHFYRPSVPTGTRGLLGV